MYPFLSIFSFQMPTYGLMSLLGGGFAILYAWLTNRGKKCGHIPGEDLTYIGMLTLVGVLIGGKVMYVLATLPFVLQHWAVLWANPWDLLSILFGGFVFYGGLFGGLLAVYWYCRKYKISFRTTVAILTPCIPLFHIFGRIGCFLAGCCWGIEVPWGFAFTHAHGGAPNGVPLLPVQLLEAGANVVLFVALAIAVRRMTRKWLVLPLYLVLYGVLRFCLEFLRGDTIRGVLLLSTSQWVALVSIAVVCVLYVTKWRKEEAPDGTPKDAPGQDAK